MNTQKFKRFIDKKNKDTQHYREIPFDACKTRVTILLGPNGTGKTMSLLGIEHYCNEHGIKCIKYSTSHDNIVHKAGFGAYDIELLAHAFTSEGERMNTSFNDWNNRYLLKELLTNEDDLVIIYDELDSGLSYDRIKSTITQIINILSMEKAKHPNRSVKLITTANSYEMYCCVDSPETTYIWVPTGEEVKFNSYKEFIKPYQYFYERWFEDDGD